MDGIFGGSICATKASKKWAEEAAVKEAKAKERAREKKQKEFGAAAAKKAGVGSRTTPPAKAARRSIGSRNEASTSGAKRAQQQPTPNEEPHQGLKRQRKKRHLHSP